MIPAPHGFLLSGRGTFERETLRFSPRALYSMESRRASQGAITTLVDSIAGDDYVVAGAAPSGNGHATIRQASPGYMTSTKLTGMVSRTSYHRYFLFRCLSSVSYPPTSFPNYRLYSGVFSGGDGMSLEIRAQTTTGFQILTWDPAGVTSSMTHNEVWDDRWNLAEVRIGPDGRRMWLNGTANVVSITSASARTPQSPGWGIGVYRSGGSWQRRGNFDLKGIADFDPAALSLTDAATLRARLLARFRP